MRKLNEKEQKDIIDTIAFVTKSHENQYRKGNGLPYVVHPISVLNTISRWGIVDDILYKAALAHDILEDCFVTFEMLIEVIGKEAADIVQELTFIPDKNSKVSNKLQKLAYIENFKSKSIKSVIIKMADRFNNTYDFYAEDPAYADYYFAQAQELFKTFS